DDPAQKSGGHDDGNVTGNTHGSFKPRQRNGFDIADFFLLHRQANIENVMTDPETGSQCHSEAPAEESLPFNRS
ncbi:MAG TPA: hypothetical protein PK653_08460, partial [Syntrophales bacterium]|nr:hypothetical protein [Syntrophales bacterium]